MKKIIDKWFKCCGCGIETDWGYENKEGKYCSKCWEKNRQKKKQ